MSGGISDRAAMAFGRQLSSPSGLGGQLVGLAMRIANRRPTRALIEALDVLPEHFVLDIGCGDGSMLQQIGQVAWRCGMDTSETMLDSSRRCLKVDIARGYVGLCRGDMLDLPFGPQSFDRFVVSNVLYFCRDVPRLIAECRRAARPRAKLGIYVTSAETMAKWRFAGPATHRHFSASQLEQELEASGVAERDRRIMPFALPAGARGLIAIVSLN
jgi:ubiquinone/menaquinone biosynthesis C-methylase UbiE